MAFENRATTVPGLVANVDLSAAQFHAVKMNANGKVELCAQGELAVGILQNKPGADEEADILTAGSTTKMVASSALDEGDFVTPSATGEGEPALTGDYILGPCLEAAGAGEIATVLLTYPGRAA